MNLRILQSSIAMPTVDWPVLSISLVSVQALRQEEANFANESGSRVKAAQARLDAAKRQVCGQQCINRFFQSLFGTSDPFAVSWEGAFAVSWEGAECVT